MATLQQTNPNNMAKWTYETLEAAGLILFSCISGSKAYGTDLPTSDTDIRFVYIQPPLEILGRGYVEQVSDATNDTTGYEIRRFIELLATANPTVIELLGMPKDTILIKHPLFEILLQQRDKFITKKLKNSMAGYARQQIQKAKGQDKMMNWERDKVERKGPLDFCYVTRNQGGSTSLAEWMEGINAFDVPEGIMGSTTPVTQANLAVVPVPHMRDVYDLFIDQAGEYARGLVGEDGFSNDLRTVSVPKGKRPSGTLFYNKDGYSTHCRVYKQYQEWLEKRNDARWVDSQTHGQKIDGKNMLHCKRLLDMSREIASGQGVIVRRPNREELLDIRKGKVNLEELLQWATEEINIVDELFDNSSLPETVAPEFMDKLLETIRVTFYRANPKLLAPII